MVSRIALLETKLFWVNRSSRQEVSCKTGVLKKFAKVTWKYLLLQHQQKRTFYKLLLSHEKIAPFPQGLKIMEWKTELNDRIIIHTTQKMTFSIKDFFSKYDKTHSFLRILSYLLRKSLMENFIFCAVTVTEYGISIYQKTGIIKFETKIL